MKCRWFLIFSVFPKITFAPKPVQFWETARTCEMILKTPTHSWVLSLRTCSACWTLQGKTWLKLFWGKLQISSNAPHKLWLPHFKHSLVEEESINSCLSWLAAKKIHKNPWTGGFCCVYVGGEQQECWLDSRALGSIHIKSKPTPKYVNFCTRFYFSVFILRAQQLMCS